MNRLKISVFVSGFGLGLALAWLVEALVTGPGVVSTYLAPLAIASPIVAYFLRRGSRASGDTRDERSR
jgi:hypothetical protein